MEFAFLSQSRLGKRYATELEGVREISEELQRLLAKPGITGALARIPEIGGTSHAVDAVVAPVASSLGFSSQRRDLFASYPTRLRPDWFLRVDDTGILLEVERGKTLTNNMDLLDLWKCHICREADHLFLVVPRQVRRTHGLENVYSRVVDRMRTFTAPENAVNVRSIAVFGY